MMYSIMNQIAVTNVVLAQFLHISHRGKNVQRQVLTNGPFY